MNFILNLNSSSFALLRVNVNTMRKIICGIVLYYIKRQRKITYTELNLRNERKKKKTGREKNRGRKEKPPRNFGNHNQHHRKKRVYCNAR